MSFLTEGATRSSIRCVLRSGRDRLAVVMALCVRHYAVRVNGTRTVVSIPQTHAAQGGRGPLVLEIVAAESLRAWVPTVARDLARSSRIRSRERSPPSTLLPGLAVAV